MYEQAGTIKGTIATSISSAKKGKSIKSIGIADL